ncbi:STAS domain-containing protein [Pullulanibacillus sp. KACC 23026]|uniref:STAS domain-containing protein n=1 Tax=Pullulanibacillus sp. KACC 23026 TaxID=3028315 RepID=UPI0023AF19A8|nr:STAS domain-containing protein [Pullulanibacillus sp. KACC 23026]WEG12527.1 STAS domain-containing protein [Pullulanibacillus sp. KACC 23026]
MGYTFGNLIESKRTEIKDYWNERMIEARPKNTVIPLDKKILESTNDNYIDLIFDYLNGTQSDDVHLQGLVKRFLAFGWPLSYLMSGLQVFRSALVSILLEENNENKGQLVLLFKEMDSIMNPIFEQLIEDATNSWEETVSIQKRALLELSAPLIPILDNIAVMPLIGTIDTERAKLIIENLLNGVIQHRSEVVLIDITGVPIVDTMVAHHIIQASEAVRLVGANCILVGIRPEIAQTIVNLGIDLKDFPTRSSLQKGVETALKLTKRKIIHTNGEG